MPTVAPDQLIRPGRRPRGVVEEFGRGNSDEFANEGTTSRAVTGQADVVWRDVLNVDVGDIGPRIEGGSRQRKHEHAVPRRDVIVLLLHRAIVQSGFPSLSKSICRVFNPAQ